jgi:putative peptidoglycan lipid II flippase
VRGSAVVGACILLGNFTGFFRVAVTAYLLGTHARADSLAVAIGPLDTLNAVILNTMLFAFVPMLMLREGARRGALFAQASRVFAVILIALSAGIAAFAGPLVSFVGPGLAAAEHHQAVTLLRLFAPSTLCAGASGIFSALLYTERRFLVPGLNQACLNLGTIAGAVWLGKIAGINGFAIGYSTGAAMQMFLTWYASRDLRLVYRLARSQPHTAQSISLADILLKPGMFLLYAGLIAGNIVVTRAFATHAGSGMAAAFDYCIRCVNVFIAYMVYPVAASLVPEIARLKGANDDRRAYRLIDRSVGLMAIAAAVSLAVGLAIRQPLIALLFQRGNFTAESTLLVSGVFLGFAPSLLGWALMDLIARCFFAMDRPRLPLIAAFIPISVNLVLMSALRSREKLMNPATLGLGASAGLVAGFVTLFTLIHLRRRALSPAPSLVEAG